MDYIIDAILEAWTALRDWCESLIEEYIPYDWETLNPVEYIEFANTYIGMVDQFLPFSTCIKILAVGIAFKYTIRAARWAITFIPAIGGG